MKIIYIFKLQKQNAYNQKLSKTKSDKHQYTKQFKRTSKVILEAIVSFAYQRWSVFCCSTGITSGLKVT